jgi:hypothetical protein
MEEKQEFKMDEQATIRCYRCCKVINPGLKYFSLNMALEVLDEDGRIGILDIHDMTGVCYNCANVILAEYLFKHHSIKPESLTDKLAAVKRRHNNKLA